MKKGVNRALKAHNDTKQGMNVVVIRKVDPTSQCSMLQEVVQVVSLGHEQKYVEWVIEPRTGACNSEEDHGEKIIGADSLPRADATF